MALLDRHAPHKVLVQNRKMTRNAQGLQVYVKDGDPVPVQCMVEPVRDWSSVEETQTLGLQVQDLAVVRSRKWPGDIHSHVVFDGSLYETVGSPQHHSVSRRTTHFRITIKWIEKVG